MRHLALALLWTVLGFSYVHAQSSEMLETDLKEGGKRVRLELILYNPTGPGPYPLLVFSHGSTGRGNQPELFGLTQRFQPIGEYFASRGWLVAVPQRRGRGKSEGRYDEGFGPDRSQGYACDPAYSLPGGERALVDLHAAIVALKRRPDVKPEHVLVGGQSRGGILAVAYAGKHPKDVLGVINFVGGWISDRCYAASQINGKLFGYGAKYPKPTLWLYGRNDRFYSLAHSKANFARFQKAGGKGLFLELDGPGDAGHDLWRAHDTWSVHVEKYLAAIKWGGR